MRSVQCLRCQHEWLPRIDGRPMQCPRCKSTTWDKQSVNKGKMMKCACGSGKDVKISVDIGHGSTVAIPPTCAECLRAAEEEWAYELADIKEEERRGVK